MDVSLTRGVDDPAHGRILHIKVPKVPELRFEYHPVTRRLFWVLVGTSPEVATCIYDNIQDPETARKAALIWIDGYTVGKTQRIEKHGREHIIYPAG